MVATVMRTGRTFPDVFFGMRDRDLGGWAGAVIALILGIATFVALGLATGT
jgi:hypothetical protein